MRIQADTLEVVVKLIRSIDGYLGWQETAEYLVACDSGNLSRWLDRSTLQFWVGREDFARSSQ